MTPHFAVLVGNAFVAACDAEKPNPPPMLLPMMTFAVACVGCPECRRSPRFQEAVFEQKNAER